MTKENNRAEMGEGWLCTRSGRPKQSVWPAQRAGKGPHAEGGEGGRRLEEAGQERGQGPSPGGRLSRSDHLGDSGIISTAGYGTIRPSPAADLSVYFRCFL